MAPRESLPWRDVATGEELLYRIDRWDSPQFKSIVEEKAVLRDGGAARAAFAALVKKYPDQVWTLRMRAQVLAQHPECVSEPPPPGYVAYPEYRGQGHRNRRRRR